MELQREVVLVRRSLGKQGLFEKSGKLTTLLLVTLLALMIVVAPILPGTANKAVGAENTTQTTGFSKPPPTNDGIVRSFGGIPSPPGNYPEAQIPIDTSLKLSLPRSIDISNPRLPVGYQGKQSSCTAWAVAYYNKTLQEAKNNRWDPGDAQRRFSPAFTYNQINGGVDKGIIFPAALELQKSKGALDISEFRYDQNDYLTRPTDAQKQAALPYRDSSYGYIWRGGARDSDYYLNKVKACLAAGKPVLIGIPVYRNFYTCKGGWVDVPAAAGEKPIGNHALCVVGYNDSAGGGKGGIKIVNSWGPGWGAAGYTYLSYKFVKEYVWEAWTTTDRHPDTPKITSISPSSGGGYGTPMTITGDNFGTQRRKSLVTVGGVQPEVISWTNAKITVKVPDEAAGGAVTATVYDWDWKAASLSFTVTPTPSPTWYLAEGSTAGNFQTYIAILNPNTTAVNAAITYMTTAGGKPGPTVNLPPGSTAYVNPGDTLGQQDFATQVTCLEGQSISVERCMAWNQTPGGVPMIEYHCSIGARAPAKDWWLAEGSSAWEFECYTTVQNPNSSDASVTTTYVIPGELPQQPSTEVKVSKTVPAYGRATFNMYEDIGENKKDASMHVQSETPIVVERSMYRYNRRGGHCSVGTTARSMTYYLAEGSTAYGFTSYILIYNPQSEDATVTVVYNTPLGGVAKAPFLLAKNSRQTITVNNDLPNTDFSAKIESTKPVVAERSMYFGNNITGEASHNSVGKAAPHTTFFFPDGATGSVQPATVLTYTAVQNPNDTDVQVQITYTNNDPSGNVVGNVVFNDTIPANSRKTYNMGDKIPEGEPISVIVKCTTSGKKIVCERSMYGTLFGVKMAGTNTVGSFGD